MEELKHKVGFKVAERTIMIYEIASQFNYALINTNTNML